MREILFRGKMKKDGIWHYGNLCTACGGKYIVSNCVFPLSVLGEVDPETVGEFTGLTDKNGVRIFEGDIVHCVAKLDNANCVVIFEEGEFRLVPVRYYETYVTGGGYHAVRCFEKEIIGNIHDNPELLKESGSD